MHVTSSHCQCWVAQSLSPPHLKPMENSQLPHTQSTIVWVGACQLQLDDSPSAIGNASLQLLRLQDRASSSRKQPAKLRCFNGQPSRTPQTGKSSNSQLHSSDARVARDACSPGCVLDCCITSIEAPLSHKVLHSTAAQHDTSHVRAPIARPCRRLKERYSTLQDLTIALEVPDL
jgi:hypothetical protein